MNYYISVVIRTYNEQKHIGEVLESLKNQEYTNFEVVLLDSGSTDDTLKIAAKYDAKIAHIKKTEFNYSFASNRCVSISNGDLVCFLSGHSVPVKKSYLADINRAFQNQKIGGCYGDVIALPDGSVTEKIYNNLGYLKNKFKYWGTEIVLEKEIHPGIFSCSNACARRDLLLMHPFSEKLGTGGEDIEVAYRIIQDGYYIAFMPDMLVKHSHGKRFLEFVKEVNAWKTMWENVLDYIKNI